MTRLAFRMDLLSNRVKGERFWSGFCSLLRFDIDDRASAISTILASFVDSFPSSLLYERGIALIPPPFSSRWRNARTIERFSKFSADFIRWESRIMEAGSVFLEKENVVFTALPPFECRNTAARLARAFHRDISRPIPTLFSHLAAA